MEQSKKYNGVTVKLSGVEPFTCERSDLVAIDARETEILIVCKDQVRNLEVRSAEDARFVEAFLNEQLELQNGE